MITVLNNPSLAMPTSFAVATPPDCFLKEMKDNYHKILESHINKISTWMRHNKDKIYDKKSIYIMLHYIAATEAHAQCMQKISFKDFHSYLCFTDKEYNQSANKIYAGSQNGKNEADRIRSCMGDCMQMLGYSGFNSLPEYVVFHNSRITDLNLDGIISYDEYNVGRSDPQWIARDIFKQAQEKKSRVLQIGENHAFTSAKSYLAILHEASLAYPGKKIAIGLETNLSDHPSLVRFFSQYDCKKIKKLDKENFYALREKLVADLISECKINKPNLEGYNLFERIANVALYATLYGFDVYGFDLKRDDVDLSDSSNKIQRENHIATSIEEQSKNHDLVINFTGAHHANLSCNTEETAVQKLAKNSIPVSSYFIMSDTDPAVLYLSLESYLSEYEKKYSGYSAVYNSY